MGILSKMIVASSLIVASSGRRHLDDKDIAIKRKPVSSQVDEDNFERATGIVNSPLVKASEC